MMDAEYILMSLEVIINETILSGRDGCRVYMPTERIMI